MGSSHGEYIEQQHVEVASSNVTDLTIFDVKDEIFRDSVCSFLDRKSICEIMKQDKLTNHFQLYKHFCWNHGTRQSHVSKEERKIFKHRKKNTTRSHRDLTFKQPGCMDCLMGLDGRLRCGECNNFADCEEFQIYEGHGYGRPVCHGCYNPGNSWLIAYVYMSEGPRGD